MYGARSKAETRLLGWIRLSRCFRPSLATQDQTKSAFTEMSQAGGWHSAQLRHYFRDINTRGWWHLDEKKAWALLAKDHDRRVVRAARAYVRDCCRSQTPAHVNELAAQLRLSRTQVTRAIKRETGKTAAHYLRHLRVFHACALLRLGLSTSKAAYHSGFGTRGSLFRVMKVEVGMTPHEFRTKSHQGTAILP